MCFVEACETGENERGVIKVLVHWLEKLWFVWLISNFLWFCVIHKWKCLVFSLMSDDQQIEAVTRRSEMSLNYIFLTCSIKLFSNLITSKKCSNFFHFWIRNAFLNIYYSLIVLASYMMHVWRSGRDWWKITISTQEESLHDGTRRDWDTKHWSLLLLCILLSHLLLHDTSSLPLINQILRKTLVLSQQLGNENFMMTITGELFLCKKLQICKNK